MTPCEKLGYEVGHVFEVVDGEPYFSNGSIVVLYEDDGGYCPLFKLIEGECENKNGKAYLDLSEVGRIYSTIETVTVTCEGRKKEINRETAIVLGLIDA